MSKRLARVARINRKRPPSWSTIRKRIIERDGGRCQKCADSKELHVHHKKERVDGGTDAPGNLITLCESCHMEWTHCAPPGLSFRKWISLPPARVVVGLLAREDAWAASTSAFAMRAMLLLAYNDRVVKRRDSA